MDLHHITFRPAALTRSPPRTPPPPPPLPSTPAPFQLALQLSLSQSLGSGLLFSLCVNAVTNIYVSFLNAVTLLITLCKFQVHLIIRYLYISLVLLISENPSNTTFQVSPVQVQILPVLCQAKLSVLPAQPPKVISPAFVCVCVANVLTAASMRPAVRTAGQCGTIIIPTPSSSVITSCVSVGQ